MDCKLHNKFRCSRCSWSKFILPILYFTHVLICLELNMAEVGWHSKGKPPISPCNSTWGDQAHNSTIGFLALTTLIATWEIFPPCCCCLSNSHSHKDSGSHLLVFDSNSAASFFRGFMSRRSSVSAQHNFHIIRSCWVCFFFLPPFAVGFTNADPRISSERESNLKVCGLGLMEHQGKTAKSQWMVSCQTCPLLWFSEFTPTAVSFVLN